MSKKFTFRILIIFSLFVFNFEKLLAVEAHLKLIKILEMNYPLEITFEQSYKNKKLEGWMVINGRGMARTEFAPPNNDLIVADGKWLMFYDPEIDRTTYLPLDKGILEALLNPGSLNKRKNFKVTEISKSESITFELNLNINNSYQKIFYPLLKLFQFPTLKNKGFANLRSLDIHLKIN